MQTKLTLRLEDDLIRRAKSHARRRGTSVSKMVADFFALLDDAAEAGEDELSPTVRDLLGVLKDTGLDESDYRRYLEEKIL
jgi:hypothetical protein